MNFSKKNLSTEIEVCQKFIHEKNRELWGGQPLPLIVTTIMEQISAKNYDIAKDHGGKPVVVKKPTPLMVATALYVSRYWINLTFTTIRDAEIDGGYSLAFWDKETGLYNLSEQRIDKLIQEAYLECTINFMREVKAKLVAFAEIKTETKDIDLVPLQNGIFNYKTKELMPFSPEYVFRGKASTKYNSNAEEPEIDGWRPSKWIRELGGDTPDDFEKLMYQIIGACLRPYISWNLAALFYNTSGRNGKGTVLSLIRGIIGEENAASIPISGFQEDFGLSQLLTKSCVLTDENSVGGYIDDAAVFKSIITGDPVQINRKYEKPLTFRYRGFMVQCVNEIPKVRDKSNSFKRRLLLVPFKKHFSSEEEKVEIKDDYIKREEVREWIVKKVLCNIDDYYALDRPEFVQKAVEEFSLDSNSIRAFLFEGLEENTYNFIDNNTLYDLYKGWTIQNFSEKAVVKKNAFKKEVKEIVSDENIGYEYVEGYRFNLKDEGYFEDNPLIANCDFKGTNKRLGLFWIAAENLKVLRQNYNDTYKGTDRELSFKNNTLRKTGIKKIS